jgi:hypothetical protein
MTPTAQPNTTRIALCKRAWTSHIVVTASAPRRALLGALLVVLLLAHGAVIASADATPAATQHCPRAIGEMRPPWIGRAKHITTSGIPCSSLIIVDQYLTKENIAPWKATVKGRIVTLSYRAMWVKFTLNRRR